MGYFFSHPVYLTYAGRDH